jgi:hypothetical protein
MKNFNLDDYIDWKKIAKDYSLESGDLSLEDTLKLEGVFKRFIETNKRSLPLSINYHLKAYNNNTIDADDCIQAIDEIVNGVIKAPLT